MVGMKRIVAEQEIWSENGNKEGRNDMSLVVDIVRVLV